MIPTPFCWELKLVSEAFSSTTFTMSGLGGLWPSGPATPLAHSGRRQLCAGKVSQGREWRTGRSLEAEGLGLHHPGALPGRGSLTLWPSPPGAWEQQAGQRSSGSE